MKVSKSLINFIKSYETLHDGDLTKIGLQPKLCPAGYWTEGYGHLMIINGKQATPKHFPSLESVIKHSTIHNELEAEEVLIKDIEEREIEVNKRLKVDVTQNEFDALVSHYFNCGYSETLYRLINTNACDSEVNNWFTTKYIRGGGVVLKGLQYRRFDECAMFFKGDYKRDYKLSI